jgi:hypothetical protein
VRRDDAGLPVATHVGLEAARNEFEAFEIVLMGPASNVVVKASALIGPGAVAINPATCNNAGDIRIYHEAFLQIGPTVGNGPATAIPPLSDSNGTGGWVPDALVPQVDEFDNKCRWTQTNLDTVAGQNQVLWVEIKVPEAAPAGHYSGQVDLAWTNGSACETGAVSVDLKVWDFGLLATGHLRSFFGSSTEPGLPHQHAVEIASDPHGLSKLVVRYAAMGLDHHIAMTNYDDGNSDLNNYFDFFSPLNGGTSSLTRLNGAAPLPIAFMGEKTVDTDYNNWFSFFGTTKHVSWVGQTFTYTVDEPGQKDLPGHRWCDIHPLGAAAHQHPQSYVIPALVTKDIDSLMQNSANPPFQSGCPSPTPSYTVHPTFSGDIADVNISTPIIDALDRTDHVNLRSHYDTFVADVSGPSLQAINQVWTYESCVTHGCGAYNPDRGIAGTTADVPNPRWPSIGAIDHSLVRARAMPWIAFKNRVFGVLYYDTLQAYSPTTDSATGFTFGGDPWHNQYFAGGNGDGTLFYPGTAAILGVSAPDIPIASLRLKMIREGLEDYEYMFQLGSNRGQWVDGLIAGVYPNAWETDRSDIDVAAALYNARHAMACQFLTDVGRPDPECQAQPPTCTDPANPNQCGTTCTNFLTDASHCGGCNVPPCGSGLCNNGVCVPQTQCAGGKICCGGDLCVPPDKPCPPAGTSCK